MIKRSPYILLATVLLLLIIVKSIQSHLHSSSSALVIGQKKYTVEVVSSIPAITKGLGARDTIGSDGMLFILPTDSIPTFWMKDMRFNLDFVWIDKGRVVDLTPNVATQPLASDSELRLYSPHVPAQWVLEMDTGSIQKDGIHIGDVVHL